MDHDELVRHEDYVATETAKRAMQRRAEEAEELERARHEEFALQEAERKAREAGERERVRKEEEFAHQEAERQKSFYAKTYEPADPAALFPQAGKLTRSAVF
jgi:hypothetical protein